MNIKIEMGTREDIDILEQLYNDTNDKLAEGINYPGWAKGIYPIRADAEKGIKNKHLYVARYHDQIVGSIIVNHEPEAAYEGVTWLIDADYSNIYVIHTLVVHPSYLKKGIGKQLMEFADSLALQNNMSSIRLDVYEHNTPALKMYKNCGYQYVATVDLGYGDFGLPWFQLYEKITLQ